MWSHIGSTTAWSSAVCFNGTGERHTMANAALDFTKPHVLRNAREYKAAVEEIDKLLDLDRKRGTEAHERLEFLSVLVQPYEDEHDPFDDRGTPQSVVAFMLE